MSSTWPVVAVAEEVSMVTDSDAGYQTKMVLSSRFRYCVVADDIEIVLLQFWADGQGQVSSCRTTFHWQPCRMES